MSSATRKLARRQAGRLKSAAGVTVYHGTSAKRVDRIRRGGLRSRPRGQQDPMGVGPWVTLERDDSIRYAIRAVAFELRDEGRLGGDDLNPAIGALVKLRVSRRDLVADPWPGEYRIPRGCRPEALLDLELFDAAPGIAIYSPEERELMLRSLLVSPAMIEEIECAATERAGEGE